MKDKKALHWRHAYNPSCLEADSHWIDDGQPLPYKVQYQPDHGTWRASFEGFELMIGTVTRCMNACERAQRDDEKPIGDSQHLPVFDCRCDPDMGFICFNCNPPIKTILTELFDDGGEVADVAASCIQILAHEVAQCQKHADSAGIGYTDMDGNTVRTSKRIEWLSNEVQYTIQKTGSEWAELHGGMAGKYATNPEDVPNVLMTAEQFIRLYANKNGG